MDDRPDPGPDRLDDLCHGLGRQAAAEKRQPFAPDSPQEGSRCGQQARKGYVEVAGPRDEPAPAPTP